jgi:anaerobic magnesium-protoporphyrin IX monomethyl ester cyclase
MCGPLDCLILVERGVSEPDLVKTLLTRSFREYFARVRSEADEDGLRLFQADGNRSLLADYGLATRISLTSVVLATELHREGLSFSVLDDDDVAGIWREAVLARLGRCRMVAVSTTYTVRLATIQRLLRLIREADPDIPVLVGGQGLSAWRLHFERPEELYERLDGADALFFGEAEGSFAELVRRMTARQPLDGIPGAVQLRGSGLPGGIPGPVPEPIEVDVNQVAIPDWSLLHDHDFNDGSVSRHGLPSVAALEEGRGCSFRCKFCSYPLYAGFRRKSPERVTAELRAVVEAGFGTVSFCGAEFLSPVEQSKLVFEAIAEAALPVEIWAYARLDLVSYKPWIADLLDRASFRYIQFGMESGDRSVLRAMNKNYDPGKMADGARMLRERGIEVYASVILGYPGETRETIANTLDVLEDCDFEHLILHVLNVVPGSPLWHRREEYGLEVDGRGFWSHRTMSLREMPDVVRSTYVESARRTGSTINNITQNFSNRFFDGTPPLSDLLAATRTLQEVVANEWAPAGPDPQRRGDLWQRLRGQVHQVPADLQE